MAFYENAFTMAILAIALIVTMHIVYNALENAGTSGFKSAWIQEWRNGSLSLAPGPRSLRGKIPISAFRV